MRPLLNRQKRQKKKKDFYPWLHPRAAAIVHHRVAAHQFDVRERTIASSSDNRPRVAWQTKGSTTYMLDPAYLLQLQTLHQCFHRYVHGKLNAMADNCSQCGLCLTFNSSHTLIYTIHRPHAGACWYILRHNTFLRDLCNAQAAAQASKVPLRAMSNDNCWKIWANF
jgi:hypothetical protein